MPPPRRDSAALDPTSRGSRYFNCASSTCSLPSRVRARRAKMSRISCVRSTILRPISCSIWRSCAGVSSLSKITTSTSISAAEVASVLILPEPRKVEASGFGRSCRTRSTTSAPAACARPASSSSEFSASRRRAWPVINPTSAARSGRATPDRPAERCVRSADIAECLPTESRRARTRVGDAPETSTIVDGAPPGVGPASISRSIRSPSERSTSSGSAVAG